MTTLAEAIRAPVEHKMSGGRTLMVHPLLLEDMGVISARIRQAFVTAGAEAIRNPDLEDEARSLIMAEAYNAAGRASFGGTTTGGMVRDLTGMILIVWLSLRRDAALADATEQTVAGILGYGKDLSDVFGLVLRVSGLIADDRAAGGGEAAGEDAGQKSEG